MISVQRGAFAHEVLAALVLAEGATAAELAADVLPLPALTLEQTTGPDRLRLLQDRAQVRRDNEQRVSRVLGRLQEAELVETRGRARPSASWRKVTTEPGPTGRQRSRVEALRLMSGWMLREEDTGAYLALLCRVENQPGSVATLSGQDGVRYRRLVEWDVLVSPAQRWPTLKGIELIRATPGATESSPDADALRVSPGPGAGRVGVGA